MAEEIKTPPKDGADEAKAQAEAREKEFTELKTQVENLNKGIATYRDEAQKANELAKSVSEELEKSKKAPKKEVKLSEEEEAKFQAYVEKMGLVSATDLAAERQKFEASNAKSAESMAVTEFLEKHPEYDDDAKWTEVLSEFSLYKTPKTLAEYRALLEKVHKNLNPGGDKDRARAEARAEIINRQRLTLGGGSQGGAGENPDEKTLENLQKKYPSLSREQIENRLAEIRALYPKKKE